MVILPAKEPRGEVPPRHSCSTHPLNACLANPAPACSYMSYAVQMPSEVAPLPVQALEPGAEPLVDALGEKAEGRGQGEVQDGLGIAKHRGDYAITTVRVHSWKFLHDYYRTEGEYIGRYVDINTPVEFYPDRIRYLDLAVEVFFGQPHLLDEPELSKLRGNGSISESLYRKALQEAHLSCREDNPF